MNKRNLLVFLLFWLLISLSSFNVFSQTLNIIDSLVIENEHVSLDNYQNIYVTNSKGLILRYDTLLQKIGTNYSPEKNAAISLLEARNPLRIFAFYRDFQEYALLDRFLTVVNIAKFNEQATGQEIGFARLAAPSSDNQLWVLDDSDFSLKKFDTQNEKTIFKTPLDLLLGTSNYDMVFLTEYQNQVFLVDKNSGILIFDNMGNFRRKIAIKNLNHICFDNYWICFTDGYQIIKEHLYQEETQKITLPIQYQQVTKKILVIKNKVLLFLGTKIIVSVEF
jgi:hypothetical protein